MRGVERRREFICTDNCSVRLNYFPLQFSVLPLALSPSSLFNSIYLAFSLSFRERRAIIGSSTPRNHGGRAKKFVCYSWKQLRKRRYSKRLHSNLITSVLRRGRPAAPARRGADISCILHSVQFRRNILRFRGDGVCLGFEDH